MKNVLSRFFQFFTHRLKRFFCQTCKIRILQFLQKVCNGIFFRLRTGFLNHSSRTYHIDKVIQRCHIASDIQTSGVLNFSHQTLFCHVYRNHSHQLLKSFFDDTLVFVSHEKCHQFFDKNIFFCRKNIFLIRFFLFKVKFTVFQHIIITDQLIGIGCIFFHHLCNLATDAVKPLDAGFLCLRIFLVHMWDFLSHLIVSAFFLFRQIDAFLAGLHQHISRKHQFYGGIIQIRICQIIGINREILAWCHSLVQVFYNFSNLIHRFLLSCRLSAYSTNTHPVSQRSPFSTNSRLTGCPDNTG